MTYVTRHAPHVNLIQSCDVSHPTPRSHYRTLPCTGGAALLRAHYDRLHPNDPAAAIAALDALFAALRARRLCVSFEMVTASHGHHGQLPAAEYLVATAAHTLDPHTQAGSLLRIYGCSPVQLRWGLEYVHCTASGTGPRQTRLSYV